MAKPYSAAEPCFSDKARGCCNLNAVYAETVDREGLFRLFATHSVSVINLQLVKLLTG